jgi:preprotein translocase subunit SecD
VTEPSIRLQDKNRIVIELPGDNDPERVHAFLMGKGSLYFHIVDDQATQKLIQYQADHPTWDPKYDPIPSLVPPQDQVAEYVTKDQYGIDQHVRWIVIHKDVAKYGLDGQYITNAEVGRDPLTNQPVVNFTLNSVGATKFDILTRDNVGKSMAVVLDGKVVSYANIREEIPNGSVQISGLDQQQAQNLSIVLRTASLPVNLTIVNQNVVGATLGAAAIHAGLQASLLGFILVVLFMLAYYKGAGLIADIELFLNLFFMVSILSVFNLTLTLTSIAGLVLTVGMAVDANVIIYERIKDEMRFGKSASASVKAGFAKAFWTIMDSNITTLIAAIFLSQLGTGPVQGFAVTLAVGIVSSMFTSLFISRLIYDFLLDVVKVKGLSISWRMR